MCIYVIYIFPPGWSTRAKKPLQIWLICIDLVIADSNLNKRMDQCVHTRKCLSWINTCFLGNQVTSLRDHVWKSWCPLCPFILCLVLWRGALFGPSRQRVRGHLKTTEGEINVRSTVHPTAPSLETQGASDECWETSTITHPEILGQVWKEKLSKANSTHLTRAFKFSRSLTVFVNK